MIAQAISPLGQAMMHPGLGYVGAGIALGMLVGCIAGYGPVLVSKLIVRIIRDTVLHKEKDYG
jgi:hypothetical protein